MPPPLSVALSWVQGQVSNHVGPRCPKILTSNFFALEQLLSSSSFWVKKKQGSSVSGQPMCNLQVIHNGESEDTLHSKPFCVLLVFGKIKNGLSFSAIKEFPSHPRKLVIPHFSLFKKTSCLCLTVGVILVLKLQFWLIFPVYR